MATERPGDSVKVAVGFGYSCTLWNQLLISRDKYASVAINGTGREEKRDQTGSLPSVQK